MGLCYSNGNVVAKVIHVLLVGKTQELKNYIEKFSEALMWLFLSAWVVCFYNLLARSLNLFLDIFTCLSLLWKCSSEKKHLTLMMLAGVTAG